MKKLAQIFKILRYFAFSRHGLKNTIAVFILVLILSALPVLFSEDHKQIPVGLIDEDHSLHSMQLMQALKNDELFALNKLDSNDFAKALNLLKAGALEAVFIIPEGFEEKIQNGDYKKTVSLYFSPFSFYGKTLSDAFAFQVMRFYLKSSVYLRAFDAVDKSTAEDALNRLASDNQKDIILFNIVDAEAVNTQEKNSTPLSFYILCITVAFYMLCTVFLPQNMQSISERMAINRESTVLFSFLYSFSQALPFLAAAVVLCIYFSLILPILFVMQLFLSFILYVFYLNSLLFLIESLSLTKSVRISFMTAFCLINAIFAYPAGLFNTYAFYSYLFPATFLKNLPFNMVWLIFYSAFFIIFGFFIKNTKKAKI